MADPSDDELIKFLRDSPGQPIPTPRQHKAWDVEKLVGSAARRFSVDRQRAEAQLDRLILETLGGSRSEDIIRSHGGDLATPAGAVREVRDTYRVDENLLDPDRRPADEGWHESA